MILKEAFAFQDGQFIAAIIEGVFGVAFDPVTGYVVEVRQGKETFPEVRIEGRFFIAFDPAALFPTARPAFFECIDYVFGVRPKVNGARFLQK